MKKLVVFVVLVAMLATATTAFAKTNKFTFNDVVIGEQVVEIQAGVKTTGNGSSYTVCSYFSDDYAEFLGEFEEAVSGGDTAEEVLAFCVANFDKRS